MNPMEEIYGLVAEAFQGGHLSSEPKCNTPADLINRHG
jgi:hypothetical protein